MLKAFLAVVAGFGFTMAVFVSGLGVATWFLAAKPVQQPASDVDVTDLWTREPRTVKTPVVGLERLPARHAQSHPGLSPETSQAAPQHAPQMTGVAGSDSIDATKTGSIGPAADSPATREGLPEAGMAASTEPSSQAGVASKLAAAHLEWCANRFRSYDAATNSYRPYSGGTRPCISPYWEAISAGGGDAAEFVTESDATTVEASLDDVAVEDASVGNFDEADAAAAPELGYASADESGSLTAAHIADCFSRYRSYRPEDNTYQPYGGGPRRQCE